MAELTQDNKPLAVETPLGKDKLLLASFTGSEAISDLFNFELELVSEDGGIKPADIIGKPVGFCIRRPDGKTRWFHGFVAAFVYAGFNDRLYFYRAQVVPWLWFLTKASDCRIFETEKSKNAREIIDKLLSGLGFSDYKWDLKRTPEKREYCVQYRETHFDFLARLLSEEGIFWYFLHEQNKHTLVLTDHPGGLCDSKDADLELNTNASHSEETNNLRSWRRNWQLTTGRYTHTDYNFETPSTSLLVDKNSVVSLTGNSKLEYYDFPGTYGTMAQGDSLAILRIEAEEARHDNASGESTCSFFSPGARFTIKAHYDPAEVGKKWALVSVQHQASIGGAWFSSDGASDFLYTNSFNCLPATTPFRPTLRPAPAIHGIQTALVVGPSGEELYTDRYGRVKVQFYWDRLGKKNERSSAWIRVSQVHAGKGWGMMDLPRIGEEVIVSFLEGNPDRPIIIGRVYNGENAPPFALPAEKTRRGNTTKSHKASGYNELSMDDTAGKEQLRINAQYNMDTNVNNNQTLNVGVDRKNKIGGNEDITIGKDQTVTIDANQTIKIGSKMKLTVGSDQQIEVGANRKDDVKADETSTVGGKQSLTVGSDRTISVSGKQAVTVTGDATLASSAKIKIEATASIELICGGSTIKISPTGIEIKGPMITVEGTATATMKALNTTVQGSALLTLSGAMTKIN